jgi:hypothetical protein
MIGIFFAFLAVIATLLAPFIKPDYRKLRINTTFLYEKELEEYKMAKLLKNLSLAIPIILVLSIIPFFKEFDNKSFNMNYIITVVNTFAVIYIFELIVGVTLSFKKKFPPNFTSFTCIIICIILFTISMVIMFRFSPNDINIKEQPFNFIFQLVIFSACSITMSAPIFMYLVTCYIFKQIFEVNINLLLDDGNLFENIIDISTSTDFITITVLEFGFYKKISIPCNKIKYIERIYNKDFKKLKKGKA